MKGHQTARFANVKMLNISRVTEALAPDVHAAFEHLRGERRLVDGWANGSTPGSRSTDPTTTVERALIELASLDELDTTLRAEIRAMEALCNDIRDSCNRINGHRAAIDRPESPRCYADPGLAGYDIPRAEGGWHDPLCVNIPRNKSGGLCNACRVRADRWRETQPKLKPLDDDRDPGDEVDVRFTADGVAHARGAA